MPLEGIGLVECPDTVHVMEEASQDGAAVLCTKLEDSDAFYAMTITFDK